MMVLLVKQQDCRVKDIKADRITPAGFARGWAPGLKKVRTFLRSGMLLDSV
jgi:hypothetical protein